MINLSEEAKNNEFVKLYIRLLKENDKYNDIYLCEDRYKERIHSKCIHINSHEFNLDLPNLLITTEINYNLYADIHKEYLKLVIPTYIPRLVNDIIKAFINNHNVDIYSKYYFNKYKKHITDKIIKEIKSEIEKGEYSTVYESVENALLHNFYKDTKSKKFVSLFANFNQLKDFLKNFKYTTLR